MKLGYRRFGALGTEHLLRYIWIRRYLDRGKTWIARRCGAFWDIPRFADVPLQLGTSTHTCKGYLFISLAVNEVT